MVIERSTGIVRFNGFHRFQQEETGGMGDSWAGYGSGSLLGSSALVAPNANMSWNMDSDAEL